MPQSLANILIHTIFSTKNRQPFLQDIPLREELHCYLGGILTNLNCSPLIVGGVEDHIHVLSQLSRTCDAADMVKELKRSSTGWLKDRHPLLKDFAWQAGYGVFSIASSQVEATRHYIRNQEVHHRTQSFQDELREIFRREDMPFDERYLWE